MNYLQYRQKLKLGLVEKQVKEPKPIAKVSEKKKAEQKDSKALDNWFVDRSKEMTGKCVECGGKTTKGDKKYWKYSICHILPKRLFKSVETHPLNFIELCHFGNSHHANFDNLGFEYAKEKMPKAWAVIVTRFRAMYPAIAPEERKFIPDILLQELEPEI